jgi:uncharacterized protein YqeY
MIDQLEADLKAALLARDELKTNVLKGIKNALNNARIEKRGDLSEADITAALRREAKQREEAAELYDRGQSPQRAERERAELAVIEKYMPTQLDEEAVLELVKKVSADVGDDKAKTGQIIGRVIAEAQGRTDGQTVARLVKQHLS